jgi:hypothetical protein
MVRAWAEADALITVMLALASAMTTWIFARVLLICLSYLVLEEKREERREERRGEERRGEKRREERICKTY